MHIEAQVGGEYDRVALSFVLHGFNAAGRIRLLRRAAAALAPGGRIGVLDWALPPGHLRATLWRRFLGALEPAAATTHELLDGALDADVPAAGLQIDRRRRAAGGRTQLLLVGRPGD